MAPTELQQLGITTMIDLAGPYDGARGMRAACRYADQTSEDMAVRAWEQSQRRAPQLIKLLAAHMTTSRGPTGPASSVSSTPSTITHT